MHSEEVIKSFVKEQLWEPKNGISSETSLYHDLGVAGDDGIEFLEKFCAKFNLPMNEINVEQHFGAESDFGLLPNLKWLFSKNYRASSKKIPIRIKDLTQSANTGKWNIEYK